MLRVNHLIGLGVESELATWSLLKCSAGKCWFEENYNDYNDTSRSDRNNVHSPASHLVLYQTVLLKLNLDQTRSIQVIRVREVSWRPRVARSTLLLISSTTGVKSRWTCLAPAWSTCALALFNLRELFLHAGYCCVVQGGRYLLSEKYSYVGQNQSSVTDTPNSGMFLVVESLSLHFYSKDAYSPSTLIMASLTTGEYWSDPSHTLGGWITVPTR